MGNEASQHTESRLTRLVRDRSHFEERYGRHAGAFLEHLPALYHLHHHLAFELELPVEPRRLAAAVVVYVAEPHDFLGEAQSGAEGLIDDVWLSYAALAMLLDRAPEPLLARHWRSATPFDDVLALARNVHSLDAVVPPRVLTLLRQYLALPA